MTATLLVNLTKGLCGLKLHNDANWCYGNSTISCLLWTLVSLQPSATNLWGSHCAELVHFIQQNIPMESPSWQTCHGSDRS